MGNLLNVGSVKEISILVTNWKYLLIKHKHHISISNANNSGST
jgi:hypothetical protein